MGKQIHPRVLERDMEFDKLTVIGVDESSKVQHGKEVTPLDWKYLCKCDCGREVSVLRWSLLKGLKTSCGCDSFKDTQHLQTGEVYSGWRILKLADNGKVSESDRAMQPRRWKYSCECIKCGRTKVITKHNLFKENPTECLCGSLLKIGTKYGRLTVIGLDEAHNENKTLGAWRYLCKCNCKLGKIVSLPRARLNSGHVNSCGCLVKDSPKKRKRPSNIIEVEGDITKVFFFNKPDTCTIIDTEDYDKIKEQCWSYRLHKDTGLEYAISTTHSRKLGHSIRLHRLITNCPEGLVPDHINGDGLDNRKANLRVSTRAENNINKRMMSTNTSGVTGVWWFEDRCRWVAELSINEKKYTRYKRNKSDAIKARKELEEKYFGGRSHDNSRGINKED